MLPFFKYLTLGFYVFILASIGAVIDFYLDTDIFKYVGILIASFLFFKKFKNEKEV